MAINITNAAVAKIKERINSLREQAKNSDPGFNVESIFLRFGVVGGGCSGFSYELKFDVEKGLNDKYVFSKGKNENDEEAEWGFEVVIDAKSYLYLNGTTIDYVKNGLNEGFVFKNPNAKSGCGCGSSFSP